MVCHRCGKALSYETTCPFCGALLTSEQLMVVKKEREEKGIDLQPKLLSEKYGMPIRQYEKEAKTNGYLIVILSFCLVLALLFLGVVFIFF